MARIAPWGRLLHGGPARRAHTQRYDDTDGKDVSTDFLRALASYLLGSGAQNHSQAALDAAARAPGAAYVLCQEMACAIGRTCDASPSDSLHCWSNRLRELLRERTKQPTEDAREERLARSD